MFQRFRLVALSLLPAAALLALGAFCTPPVAYAQISATLSGTVSDPSGAAVQSAKATLANEATGETRSTTANGAGVFNFPALNPGSYKLRIDAAGFQPFEQTGITLNSADQRKVPNIQLQVGSSTQAITRNRRGNLRSARKW